MIGVLHVIDQMGLAMRGMQDVIEQQQRRIADLERQLAEGAPGDDPLDAD